MAIYWYQSNPVFIVGFGGLMYRHDATKLPQSDPGFDPMKIQFK